MLWPPTWKAWLDVKAVLIFTIFLLIGRNEARVVGDYSRKGTTDAALELTTATFNSTLWASSAPFAIVEFYAHWCPACQNFKAQYERVANLFNGPEAVYPGVLLVARVDCAQELNRYLCQRFPVKRYPSLLWGKPASFAGGSGFGEKDKVLEQIESRMNAESVLTWINARLQGSYSFDSAKQKQQLARANDAVSGQPVPSLYDIEEATAEAYNIILANELVSSNHRAPFVQFLQLLAAHHPSRRCRAGSAQILFNLMDAWPAEHVLEIGQHFSGADGETNVHVADVNALRQFHICGENLPHNTYKTCNSVTGGYRVLLTNFVDFHIDFLGTTVESCGLWYLFHALSVRVDDMESKGAMKAICDFVDNFFICEECQKHFSKMSKSAVEEVSSRRDLSLWLWRAHNEVNRRLAKESETKSTSEHHSLKLQWPSKQMCASCRIGSEDVHNSADSDIKWNDDKVYQFLGKTYGQSIWTVAEEVSAVSTRQLDKLYKGKDENVSSNAITVPVGAALGIALASSGFGIAACCWRLQQKKRKYFS